MTLKSNKQKKQNKKIIFVGILEATDQNSKIRIQFRKSVVPYGSADQDPYQYVTDTQRWLLG